MLRALDADGRVEKVHLVVTETGMRLLTSELGINATESKSLPAMITGNIPTYHPHIRAGRCASVAVSGTGPLCVHTDGELFCRPRDGVTQLAVELLPRRLRVEVCRAFLYGERTRPGQARPLAATAPS